VHPFGPSSERPRASRTVVSPREKQMWRYAARLAHSSRFAAPQSGPFRAPTARCQARSSSTVRRHHMMRMTSTTNSPCHPRVFARRHVVRGRNGERTTRTRSRSPSTPRSTLVSARTPGRRRTCGEVDRAAPPRPTRSLQEPSSVHPARLAASSARMSAVAATSRSRRLVDPGRTRRSSRATLPAATGRHPSGSSASRRRVTDQTISRAEARRGSAQSPPINHSTHASVNCRSMFAGTAGAGCSEATRSAGSGVAVRMWHQCMPGSRWLPSIPHPQCRRTSIGSHGRMRRVVDRWDWADPRRARLRLIV